MVEKCGTYISWNKGEFPPPLANVVSTAIACKSDKLFTFDQGLIDTVDIIVGAKNRDEAIDVMVDSILENNFYVDEIKTEFPEFEDEDVNDYVRQSVKNNVIDWLF